MTEETPEASSYVDNELDEHKSDLKGWIGTVSTMVIPDSRKKVVERFIRDCKTLLDDLDCDSVSAPDLCDFNDRRNSLEVQYHAISQDQ